MTHIGEHKINRIDELLPWNVAAKIAAWPPTPEPSKESSFRSHPLVNAVTFGRTPSRIGLSIALLHRNYFPYKRVFAPSPGHLLFGSAVELHPLHFPECI
jgi:hypothetical protein